MFAQLKDRRLFSARQSLSPRPEARPAAKPREAHGFAALAGHDFGRMNVMPRVQTKLKLNTPGDIYEQEAEQMADRVMRMPQPQGGPASITTGGLVDDTIQRISAHENPSLEDIEIREEEEIEAVQTLRNNAGESGTAQLSSERLAGAGGEPLHSDVREFMEPRFGADFSRVRIHADNEAEQLSDSLRARAFTHGSHIYFGRGEYRPGSLEGRRVLAHELTHVIQQGAAPSPIPTQGLPAGIQRMSAAGKKLADNVHPWTGQTPVGANYEATTDAGSKVVVWIAYPVLEEQYSYWCHGHSFDTYNRFGYSVYSGSDTSTVIKDEWTGVPQDQTTAGDIAVWTSKWNHSAKFVNPVITGGSLDPAASQLSTKNGQSALTTMSLAALAKIYGGAGIGVFRHR